MPKRNEKVLLTLDHLCLTLGGNPILNDVCAQITGADDVGEIVVMLGPSGVGKSQLSLQIAGLRAPTSGAVRLANDQPTRPGEVCMVPQYYALFDYTTVFGNLLIAGRMGGYSREDAAKKIAEYVQTFDLGDHISKYPDDLSGGTKQRVAIVRQLMCASRYIVMDEPFSGLDVIMKRAAMDSIVKLSEFDTYSTSIIVTHDVTEGMSIADRVWLLGKVDGGGARVVEDMDLAAMGLAWRPDIQYDKVFQELVLDVKARFPKLLRP